MKNKKKGMGAWSPCDACVKVVAVLLFFSCVVGHAQGSSSQPVAEDGKSKRPVADDAGKSKQPAVAEDGKANQPVGEDANYSMYGKAKIDPKHIIIAVGDSLTQGTFPDGRAFHPYTATLQEKLNDAVNRSRRFEILNKGLGGKCVFKRFMNKLPKILAKEKAKIDLVIILAGAEDIVSRCKVAEYMIKLHRMVHRAGMTSVVATIPARADDNAKIEFARHKANTKLRVFALEHRGNTLLCDLADESRMKKSEYWEDSVHPTIQGYDKIADFLFKTIRPELKKDGKLF